MKWELVLDFSAEEKNLIPRLITFPATYDTLYVGIDDRSASPAPRLLRIRQQTPAECEDVTLPQAVDSEGQPITLWGIGPMANVYETTESGHNGDDWSWGHENLCIAATGSIPMAPVDTLATRAILYKGDFDADWNVELTFPAGVPRDRLVAGLKEKIVLTHGTTIFSNASGSWDQGQVPMGLPAMEISALYALPNVLYAGTWSNRWQDHGAEVWKTYDALNWQREYSSPDPKEWGFIGFARFDGKLYAASENVATGFRIWCQELDPIEQLDWWHDITPTWPKQIHGYDFVQNPFLVSDDETTLYVGTGGPWPVILSTQDGTNWDWDFSIADVDDTAYGISSLAWFCDNPDDLHAPPALYAGVINSGGCQVWRASPPTS